MVSNIPKNRVAIVSRAGSRFISMCAHRHVHRATRARTSKCRSGTRRNTLQNFHGFPLTDASSGDQQSRCVYNRSQKDNFPTIELRLCLFEPASRYTQVSYHARTGDKGHKALCPLSLVRGGC